MDHESALHRIAVHVIQFLEQFFFTVDIEVVIAALPESLSPGQVIPKGQRELAWRAAPFAAKYPGNALLQHLDDFGRSGLGRFIDQQMDVLGHEHIAEEPEAGTCADLTKDFHEEISGALTLEEGTALEATEGDEVQIAVADAALESARHKRKSSPPFAKNAKGRAPSLYHSRVTSDNGILAPCMLDRKDNSEG